MTSHTPPPSLPTATKPQWQTRRIVVLNDAPCVHCQNRSFLVDPEIGTTCTQCAKPPHRPRRKEQLFL